MGVWHDHDFGHVAVETGVPRVSICEPRCVRRWSVANWTFNQRPPRVGGAARGDTSTRRAEGSVPWTPKLRVACSVSQVAAAMPCAVQVSSPRSRFTPRARLSCAWSETSFYSDLDGDLSDPVEVLRHTDQLFGRDLLILSGRMERSEARSEPCFVEDEMSAPFDGRSCGCSVTCASSTASSAGISISSERTRTPGRSVRSSRFDVESLHLRVESPRVHVVPPHLDVESSNSDVEMPAREH